MLYSMKFLSTSSLYFPLWLLMGIAIYAGYGYEQKRLEEKQKAQRMLKQPKVEV